MRNLLAILALLTSFVVRTSSFAAEPRPNLVFVLTDNQELTYLPYHGGRFVDEWDLADALAVGDASEALVAGQKTESVYKCADEIQCNMLVSLLEGERIPCLVKSQEVTSLDGLLVSGAGFWADLHVFAEDADRAKRLIGEFLDARNQE